ncbi:VOC family protein [Cellulomonas massiliensis]|uniref:VOC family protein n=1 Tax=Cellulomonas massiliensis TaxID=1465811 RepID=UPI0002EF2647|nr:VOC family protein [Cellulomonas massiliensis]
MTTDTAGAAGPDFVSFQVRDLAASADFYERLVGLTRLPAPNPQAAVFSRGGTSFAVRAPLPGVDLDAGPLGLGVGVWFHDPDAGALHARLVEHGVTVTQEPAEGPFGTTFAFRDPDGYEVTIHSRG